MIEQLGLSVIVPCFNEIDTIESVIAAVRNCGLDDIEIIVVDDFSTDGTRELLSGKLSAKIDKLILQKKIWEREQHLQRGLSLQQKR